MIMKQRQDNFLREKDFNIAEDSCGTVRTDEQSR